MKLESRHLTFAGLALVVVVSMLVGFNPELTPSDDTETMFAYLDSIPEGSVLLVSFDHEASSLPEIKPLAIAFLRHAMGRKLRLIGLALLAEGTGIGYNLMNEVGTEYHRTYGVDYVYLGFKPQYVAAILSLGESFGQTFPEDYLGQAYDDFPLAASVQTYADVAGVISISDGSMTTHWIEYGNGRYGVTVATFTAAAMVTTYDPYLASGQLRAMVGGLRGAAEYEKLLGIGGSGARGMLAQTSMHLYVILLIIIGNVIYFRSRRKGNG